MYECWNPNCPNYRGNGVRLGPNHVLVDETRHLHCRACGQFVRVAVRNTNDENARGLVGAGGGALVGGAIGGPPGALLGAIIGGILGLASGSQSPR